MCGVYLVNLLHGWKACKKGQMKLEMDLEIAAFQLLQLTGKQQETTCYSLLNSWTVLTRYEKDVI